MEVKLLPTELPNIDFLLMPQPAVEPPPPLQYAAVVSPVPRLPPCPPSPRSPGRPPERIPARVHEDHPAIMRFAELRRDHPRRTLDAEGRRRYATLAAGAAQARRYLADNPQMVEWYAEREALAMRGEDVDAAGPSPATKEGRAWAQAAAVAAARHHDYFMSCDLPEPAMVRPGDRSKEAIEARREAHQQRAVILRYRKQQESAAEALQRTTDSSRTAMADPATTARDRRAARAALPWLDRVGEDDVFMAREGLSVRCHTPTQGLPMIRRLHRVQA